MQNAIFDHHDVATKLLRKELFKHENAVAIIVIICQDAIERT